MGKCITLTLPTVCATALGDEFFEDCGFDSIDTYGSLTFCVLYYLSGSDVFDEVDMLINAKIPYELMIEDFDCGEEHDPHTTCVQFGADGKLSITHYKGREPSISLADLVVAMNAKNLYELVAEKYNEIDSWENQIKFFELRQNTGGLQSGLKDEPEVVSIKVERTVISNVIKQAAYQVKKDVWDAAIAEHEGDKRNALDFVQRHHADAVLVQKASSDEQFEIESCKESILVD